MEKSIFTHYSAILTRKLRELRETAGLTQRELAQRLRVAQTIVARLEQGQRRLDIIEFYLLCKALKIDPIKTVSEVLRQCRELDKVGRKQPRR